MNCQLYGDSYIYYQITIISASKLFLLLIFYFKMTHGDVYKRQNLKDISAGVTQGCVLGQVLYLFYTGDIPKCDAMTTATFADDTALLLC